MHVQTKGRVFTRMKQAFLNSCMLSSSMYAIFPSSWTAELVPDIPILSWSLLIIYDVHPCDLVNGCCTLHVCHERQCLAAVQNVPYGSSNKEDNQETIVMPCNKHGCKSDKDGFAEAEQPEDWDEEEDGEWEPPRITNPKCEDGPGCGEWERPTISNPNYKGTWYPPMIDNPEYKVSSSCSFNKCSATTLLMH